MRHRLLALLLLLCLSWQVLASAAPSVLGHGESDESHALLHYLDGAHHHHDHDDDHDEAASLHEDGNGAAESVAHVMSDACMQSPALLSGSSFGLLSLTPTTPPSARVHAPPIPPLLGLERPPRLTA